MASTAFVQTQARTDLPKLFDQTYLDTFHQKFALSDRYQIMNKQTFLDWWKIHDPPSRSVRNSTMSKRTRYSRLRANENKTIEEKTGELLASTVCGKSIGNEYSKYTSTHLFTNPNYDVAIVVDVRKLHLYTRRSLRPNTIQRKKSSFVAGFIVAQWRECEWKPAFSVNLICVNQTEKGSIPRLGSKLMTMFLCSILNLPVGYLKEAVLELSGGIRRNTPGFISYSSLGFRYKPDLYRVFTAPDGRVLSCFSDRDNYPMKIDLTADILPITGYEYVYAQDIHDYDSYMLKSGAQYEKITEKTLVDIAMGARKNIMYHDDDPNLQTFLTLRPKKDETLLQNQKYYIKYFKQHYSAELDAAVAADPDAFHDHLVNGSAPSSP
jgi:hypothetical protein